MEKSDLKVFALIAVAIAIICLFALFYVSQLEQLKQKATGTKLILLFEGGERTETVEPKDITAISFVACPNSDKGCYRLSIKEEPLWYIYYDAMSFELVEIEQLFDK